MHMTGAEFRSARFWMAWAAILALLFFPFNGISTAVANAGTLTSVVICTHDGSAVIYLDKDGNPVRSADHGKQDCSACLLCKNLRIASPVLTPGLALAVQARSTVEFRPERNSGRLEETLRHVLHPRAPPSRETA